MMLKQRNLKLKRRKNKVNKTQSTINKWDPFFDYGRDKNALIGTVGTFDIKRIRVIQLE